MTARVLKISLLILALLCIGWGPMMLSTKPASLTCTQADSFGSGEDAATSIGAGNGVEYLGTVFTPASNVSVCQVDFYITSDSGDTSVNDYYVEIWTLSGDNLSAIVTNGRSAKVDGGGSVDSWWEFTFSSYPSLTASTPYAIFAKAIDNDDPADTIGEWDATNYANWAYDNENNSTATFGGRYAWESSDLSNTIKDIQDDGYIQVHTMQ